MIYVAELLDIKICAANGFPVGWLKLGETEFRCLMGRYGELSKKIKNFPVGGKYKFDFWIDAGNEFESSTQTIKEMQILKDDYLFPYLVGILIEMRGFDEYGIPEVRIETENGLVFDVTGIQGPSVFQYVKPGDYIEILHGYYFIKDIYPLDYEEPEK